MNRWKGEEYERIWITLIRHATVTPGWQAVCYGNTGIPLATTSGEEVPHVVAQINLSLYDRILSSPLPHALRLACYYVPEGTHVEVDDHLKEVNFGDWEGQSQTSILRTEQEVPTFFKYFIDRPTPRGESLHDLAQRVADLLGELYRSGAQRVLLFSHGGIVDAMRSTTGRITLQEALTQILPYGDVTTIKLDDLIHVGQMRL